MSKYLLKMFWLCDPDMGFQEKQKEFSKLSESVETAENFLKFCKIAILVIGYEIWRITKTAKIKIIDVWKGRS